MLRIVRPVRLKLSRDVARCLNLRDVLSVRTLILRVVPPVQKCAMTAAFGINYPARCRAVYRRGMSSANRKPGSDFAPANPARSFLKMSLRQASRFADNANNPTLNSG